MQVVVGLVCSFAICAQTIEPGICACAVGQVASFTSRCTRLILRSRREACCAPQLCQCQIGVLEHILRFGQNGIGVSGRCRIQLIDFDPQIFRSKRTRRCRRDDKRVVRTIGNRQKLAEDRIVRNRLFDGVIYVNLSTIVLIASANENSCRCFVAIRICDRTSCIICVKRHDTTACGEVTIEACTGQRHSDGCTTNVGQRRLNARQVVCCDVAKTLCIRADVVKVEGPDRSRASARCVHEIIAGSGKDIRNTNTINSYTVIAATSVDHDVVDDRLVKLVVVVVFSVELELNRNRVCAFASGDAETGICIVKRVTRRDHTHNVRTSTRCVGVVLVTLIAVEQCVEFNVAAAQSCEGVEVGDTTRVHVRVDITQRQVAFETIGVNQLEIAGFNVCIWILVETVANDEARKAVTVSIGRVSHNVDCAQRTQSGCNCANIGWLRESAVTTNTFYRNVKHFDTASNTFACVLRLATNDQVTTFTAATSFLKLNINCDGLILLFEVSSYTTKDVERVCVFIWNCEAQWCDRRAVAGNDADRWDQIRERAVLQSGTVQCETVVIKDNVRVIEANDLSAFWQVASCNLCLQVCLQCRNERVVIVDFVRSVLIEKRAIKRDFNFLTIDREADTVVANLIQTTFRVLTAQQTQLSVLVEQEEVSLANTCLTCQQVVVVEVDSQVRSIVITVKIVCVIHCHGDFGGVTRSTTFEQRCQVLNNEITIRVVRPDFLMVNDVLRIDDDSIVRVRARFSVVTCFDIDFFDACQTRLNVCACRRSIICSRAKEFKAKLCI